MARNMDMTALRSFVAVAETGGVTRAAGLLNLTQSAVSMQLKRLEEGLALSLFQRAHRSLTLTASGEQLLSYARRILTLNDEALTRLTDAAFEGEITLGVPHDIIHPTIPQVLKRLNELYPRIRVQLLSSFTRDLKAHYDQGEADVILTTETFCGPGGITLAEKELCWIGAVNGSAWKRRPVPLAFERRCLFRPGALDALDRAGIDWDMGVESDNTRSVDAMVSADLAIHARIAGTEPDFAEIIPHNGALPDLGGLKINMYARGGEQSQVVGDLQDLIIQAWKTF